MEAITSHQSRVNTLMILATRMLLIRQIVIIVIVCKCQYVLVIVLS